MEEKERKKLNVAVITDSTEYGNAAVRYGVLLAQIFNGELMVFSNFRLKKREFKREKGIINPHLCISKQLNTLNLTFCF